jgi:hypothetical protein
LPPESICEVRIITKRISFDEKIVNRILRPSAFGPACPVSGRKKQSPINGYLLSYGCCGREFGRNTSKNLTKRTILSFLKGNRRCYAFMVGSMGLDPHPKISDQRIPL